MNAIAKKLQDNGPMPVYTPVSSPAPMQVSTVITNVNGP